MLYLYKKIIRFKGFFVFVLFHIHKYIPGTEKREFQMDCDCFEEVRFCQLFVDEFKLKLRPKSSFSTISLLLLLLFSVSFLIQAFGTFLLLCTSCSRIERRIYELLRGTSERKQERERVDGILCASHHVCQS